MVNNINNDNQYVGTQTKVERFPAQPTRTFRSVCQGKYCFSILTMEYVAA